MPAKKYIVKLTDAERQHLLDLTSKGTIGARKMKRAQILLKADEGLKDEAIVAALKDRLKQGDKSLIGNKGYRRFVKSVGKRFEIDEEKVQSEARFDGIWVLQTDAELTPTDTALKYKELWMVEAIFRTVKSILETRPVYHKCDDTIRGHVFCSFLALVLLKELQGRLAARGWRAEWEYLKRDLDALEEITVKNSGRTFVIRSRTRGSAGKALQAAGVALGPTVRFCG